MQTYQFKREYYFQADASTLGGTLVQPLQTLIPAQASASLPAAGGIASSRSGAFNFEGIVGCAAAFVHVAGRKAEDGSASVLVRAVVEGLNILDVITADRIVAQLTVHIPTQQDPEEKDPARKGQRRFSVLASRFEGLRLGGVEVWPHVVPRLLMSQPCDNGTRTNLTRYDFRDVGREQAKCLVDVLQDDCDSPKATDWVNARYGWMLDKGDGVDDRCSLSSLFDYVAVVPNCTIPGRSFGHVVELPGFGRVLLGEILVCPTTVQLTMIRAELGCATSGSVSVASAHSGVHTIPPS
jgi:hypothetical protein